MDKWQATKLVKKFDEAAHDHAFIGSQPLQDHDGIRNRYLKTKDNLIRALTNAKQTNTQEHKDQASNT